MAPGAALTAVAKSGPLRFARYAYPPNVLGYCGPGDSLALLQHASVAEAGADLTALARQFAGAWPYLELIAASAGRPDPLDDAVVEAYWLGNPLLERVDPRIFAAHLADRFEPRAGRGMADIATLALMGAMPHHNFHVFAVYPWVGLLRAGTAAEEPLRVLNSCRVRWGRVMAVGGLTAEVSSQPLIWDGVGLHLGPATVEEATLATEHGSLAHTVRPGDVVGLHWDWICEVLQPRQLSALRRLTGTILRMTNEALARPMAAAVLL